MTSILITGIIIYAIVAFLIALAIGFFRPNTHDFLALLIVCFWPLTLMVIVAVIINDAIDDWVDENPGAVHRIGSILYCITIPFRPITLGRKIREWLDNRKGDHR